MSTAEAILLEPRIEHSGRASILFEEWAGAAWYPPEPQPQPLTPYLILDAHIDVSSFVQRHLSVDEQRLLQSALRRSVRVVRAGALTRP